MCTNGVSSLQELNQRAAECATTNCTLENKDAILRLIPSLNFTCSGRITQWQAVGDLSNSVSDRLMVSIWRPRTDQPRSYKATGGIITLGQCSTGIVRISESSVYECSLINSEQVQVEGGDIIGIDAPRAINRRAFKLYFDRNQGPVNHEFQSITETLTLSDATTVGRDLPLLILRVQTDTNNSSTTTTTNVTASSTVAPTTNGAENSNTTTTTITSDNSTMLLPTTADIEPSQTTSEKTSVHINSTPTTTIILPSQSTTVTEKSSTVSIDISGADMNNTFTDKDGDSSTFDSAKITMIAVFAGLGLMPLIIIVLTMALVCSVRKNRKLKRKMTKKVQDSSSFNKSTETILNSERTEDELISMPMHMEVNIAYTKSRKKSESDHDYVINELVYASIEEFGQQELVIGSPDAYEDVSEPIDMDESQL